MYFFPLDLHLQVSIATAALQKSIDECELAKVVKSFFDRKYGPNWICIAGRHFAHEGSWCSGTHAFFNIGHVAVLLYRIE